MADPTPLDSADRLAIAYALATGRTGLRLTTLDVTDDDRFTIAGHVIDIHDELHTRAIGIAGCHHLEDLIEQVAPKRKEPTT